MLLNSDIISTEEVTFSMHWKSILWLHGDVTGSAALVAGINVLTGVNFGALKHDPVTHTHPEHRQAEMKSSLHTRLHVSSFRAC